MANLPTWKNDQTPLNENNMNSLNQAIEANETAIATKLNKPSADGSSGQVLSLDTNGNTVWVDPTNSSGSLVLDTTLSQKGQAADAKAVGDALTGKANNSDLDNKITAPATAGTTGQVLTINADNVPEWKAVPTTPQIALDKTLAAEGKAADAKAVGDALANKADTTALAAKADKTALDTKADKTALDGKLNAPATAGTEGQILALGAKNTLGWINKPADGTNGTNGQGIFVATVGAQTNSDVKKTDITNGANIKINDILIDNNGDVYAIESVNETVAHVGTAKFNLKPVITAQANIAKLADPATATAQAIATTLNSVIDSLVALGFIQAPATTGK